MGNVIDLTGRTFRELTVIRRDGSDRHGAAMWRCRCSCGREKTVRGYNLCSEHPIGSCGICDVLKPRRKNLSGRVFHWTTAERYLFTDKFAHWQCRCRCGKRHVASSNSLLRGYTKSCGCYKIFLNKQKKKPWLTDADRRNRRSGGLGDPFRITAQRTFARDAFTCLGCGGGGKLAAHHILPWYAYPEHRYSMKNLVTLCAACHKDFHSLYGFDCDLDDLEEFLKEIK